MLEFIKKVKEIIEDRFFEDVFIRDFREFGNEKRIHRINQGMLSSLEPDIYRYNKKLEEVLAMDFSKKIYIMETSKVSNVEITEWYCDSGYVKDDLEDMRKKFSENAIKIYLLYMGLEDKITPVESFNFRTIRPYIINLQEVNKTLKG